MTKIKLDYFKSILCLNGEIPPKSFFDKFPNFTLIATDGAGSALLQMGITPNIIIGDFDSFSGDLHNPNIIYIKYTDQNSTDFEKAILKMQKRELFPSLVCGAFGKEIDHTLSNINSLIKYGKKHSMIFYDHTIKEKPKYCIPIYDQFNFKATKGQIISLLPYPKAIISTKGLKWNLNNESLTIKRRSGSRNQAENTNIEVTIHQGQILLICEC